jgi:hypothetical protein
MNLIYHYVTYYELNNLLIFILLMVKQFITIDFVFLNVLTCIHLNNVSQLESDLKILSRCFEINSL